MRGGVAEIGNVGIDVGVSGIMGDEDFLPPIVFWNQLESLMVQEMGWDQKSLLRVMNEASLETFLLILQWLANNIEVKYLHLDPTGFESF